MISFWFEKVPDIIFKVLDISFLETTEDLAAFAENFDHKFKNEIPCSLWLCFYKTHDDRSFSRKKLKSAI